MTAERILDVWWDDDVIGHFQEQASALARFWYEQDYDGYPISVSMPIRPEPYEGRVPYDFLTNLLPEADRDRLARHHRLNADDAIGLIGALGRECAGALQIVPSGERPANSALDYRALTDLELTTWLETRSTLPLLLDSERQLRLSLAGTQAKAAVTFDPRDNASLPINGAPTTHILKPGLANAVPNTAHIELFAMQLASNVLGEDNVPETDLWRNLFRIRRFDRPLVAGRIARWHQEDLCQALGLSVHAKYESLAGAESGYVAQAMALLNALGDRGLVASPAIERGRLLDLVIVNVLIHNADAHLKNYALLYTPEAGIRMAPLYDALCTAGITFRAAEQLAYATNPLADTLLSKDLGLRIGNATRIDEVDRNDWHDLARDCGLTKRFVVNRVDRLADAVLAALEETTGLVSARYPASATAVEATQILIREQTQHTAGQLRRARY